MYMLTTQIIHCKYTENIFILYLYHERHIFSFLESSYFYLNMAEYFLPLVECTSLCKG